MHGPAPLSLDHARDGGAWRLALGGLHAVAAGAVFAWRPDLPGLALAAVVTVAGLWAWRRAAAGTPQRLVWDGQVWHLDAQPVRPRVALDFGGWMLLQLEGAGPGRRWLPISPAAGAAVWPGLRAALYALPARAD